MSNNPKLDPQKRKALKEALHAVNPAKFSFSEQVDTNDHLEKANETLDEIKNKSGEMVTELKKVGEELAKEDPGIKDVFSKLSLIKGEKGDKGDTPSDEELIALIKPLIPEVRDGIDGQDGKTPTREELLALIRPLIKIPKDGETPSDERLLSLIIPLIPKPKNGKDGKDGKSPTPKEVISEIKKLEGAEADDFSKTVASKIEFSHLRNASSFMFNKKKYKIEELMHGAGSVTVQTENGSVNVSPLKTLKVANGTLTDDGNGVASLDTGSVTIQTENGSVTVPSLKTLKVTNGTLTDDGSGVASLDTGGGGTWTEVTATSANMAVNVGYIANNASLVTLTLPTTAAQGSIIEVAGKGAGGWAVAQNDGQTIHFGVLDTTTGATGGLASNQQYDTVRLLCITADTDFIVLSNHGTITVT